MENKDFIYKEKVNHPQHYNRFSIEPIEVIEDWELNFNLGNVVKYVGRLDGKDAPIQELEKAKWYLEREIERRLKKIQKNMED